MFKVHVNTPYAGFCDNEANDVDNWQGAWVENQHIIQALYQAKSQNQINIYWILAINFIVTCIQNFTHNLA